MWPVYLKSYTVYERCLDTFILLSPTDFSLGFVLYITKVVMHSLIPPFEVFYMVHRAMLSISENFIGAGTS